VLDEIGMEKRATDLLRTLSVKIPACASPSRRSPADSANRWPSPRHARPAKVVLLDEPTAALGVEQTAQVLDLIERLREQGHGRHPHQPQLADVRAVADRVVVLRLGKNGGDFRIDDVTHEQIVAAITVHRTTLSRAAKRAPAHTCRATTRIGSKSMSGATGDRQIGNAGCSSRFRASWCARAVCAAMSTISPAPSGGDLGACRWSSAWW